MRYSSDDCAPSQEVGEESRLARSFDRIRSIVRKKRNKEKNENETNTKLEKLVNEVIVRRRHEKMAYSTCGKPHQEFTTLGVEPHETALYRHSYQVNGVIVLGKLTRLG